MWQRNGKKVDKYSDNIVFMHFDYGFTNKSPHCGVLGRNKLHKMDTLCTSLFSEIFGSQSYWKTSWKETNDWETQQNCHETQKL